ncbi:hypothetical protein [Pelobium manganitolerans]|uniref:hypothetical protein n=1 Tax=Pelobium manganitolerans TaxID=1842495 RepID=UPI003FA3D4E3
MNKKVLFKELNFNRKVLDVQEIYLHHSANGASNEWIFINKIHPSFHISRSTFYEYLTVNAKAKIKELEQKLNIKEVTK